MPLFIDVHNAKGISPEQAAIAHEKDLEKQGEHGVNYKNYWVSKESGKIFCLVEAPNAEAARAVHREAHGLVADEIFEVDEGK